MRGRVLTVVLRRFLPRILLGALLVAVPRVFGQALPDLGDVSQATITLLQERRLGESIMREVRADRTYYDEPEATDYLTHLGTRLGSFGAGLLSQAIPSRSVSSLLGSVGSARSTA